MTTNNSDNNKNQRYPHWIRLIFHALSAWLWFYDLLAYIPFQILADPEKKLRKSNRIKAKPLYEDKPGSPFRRLTHFEELLTKEFANCDTLDKIWSRAVGLYSNQKCLGTREVKAVDEEVQNDGRHFGKLTMGKYTWRTYKQVQEEIDQIGSGLLRLNVKRDDKIVIISETRAEWMVTALMCFRYQFTAVSLYPTLSVDGIVHGINEVESEVVFTSQDLADKILNLVDQCPKMRMLIYYSARIPDPQPIDKKNYDNVVPKRFQLLSYEELLNYGAEKPTDPTSSPRPEDTALIMYTSGTTGLPKGVILSHSNIVAGNAGQCYYVRDYLNPSNIYVGYLPAAHVLELTAEFGSISHGVPVGFSSPTTLTDKSSRITPGTQGDLTVLKPSLMAAVPTIMDRIYKAVMEEVAGKSAFSRALFRFCYERKRRKIENGYETPILDMLIFSKIRAILGGNVQLMLSGGAPLNAETQRFMNICFCCPVGQGYGLTETSGAGTVCDVDDISTGRCGPPLPCSDVMLRDWPEGGYMLRNKPRPQGEIMFSGANVATYYKNDDLVARDFVQIDGRRWFCTGDIGEMHPDGTLKVIDRKKDLIKLQHGEYISLAKVETALLTNPLVDNVCAYGDPASNYMVVLVVPNENGLKDLAKKLNVASENFDDLRMNKQISNAVLRELQEHAKKNQLEKYERPAKVYLCKEVWTVDSGLLTDAMKLKRKPLEKFYKDILRQMYL